MIIPLISFLAGMLTILAPCVLPLLPIILSGSLEQIHDKYRPYIIIGSLIFSIILFSVLLKATTILFGVDQGYLKGLSAGIIILFGLIILFPNIWKKISGPLLQKSNNNLIKNTSKGGVIGSIFIGFSLGPVFSSCSPTYAMILAIIFPVSFFNGMVYLFFYALGLGCMLLLITLLGKKIIYKCRWVANPNGIFKKVLGMIFIGVGIMILTGFDKTLESLLIDYGYDGAIEIESILEEHLDKNIQ